MNKLYLYGIVIVALLAALQGARMFGAHEVRVDNEKVVAVQIETDKRKVVEAQLEHKDRIIVHEKIKRILVEVPGDVLDSPVPVEFDGWLRNAYCSTLRPGADCPRAKDPVTCRQIGETLAEQWLWVDEANGRLNKLRE